MNFAFLVHPLGNETDEVMGYLREVDLHRSFDRGMASLFHDLHVVMERAKAAPRGPSAAARPVVIDELPGLASTLSARADGRLYEIPMDSAAILGDPHRALGYMREALRSAVDWGAQVVGLGAMTGIVGGHGTELAESSPVAVTTGNSLTVYAAVANLRHACTRLEIDLAAEDVVVVGVPGSIAAAAARLLRAGCRSMRLVARQPSARAAALARELAAELSYDVQAALARSRVVLSATSSGGCIDQAWLAPGAVLSDVGVPTDTIGGRASRSDVLILSGGLCRVPEAMPLTSHYLWFHCGAMAACLAETVVLALDEAPECLSLGRDLDPARIEHIGRRAQAHGFDFSSLFAFGQPLGDAPLTAYGKARARVAPAAAPAPASPPHELGALAGERFRRHINPAMAAVAGALVRTFVKGAGSRVWDAAGRGYLDFLAGYGALNLGHNHPAVVAAVRAALAEDAPGFSPAAINPYAAALAERLAAATPAGLELAFFANSGAEAVEAGLKLARRATGRRGLLYCERSYHGKTLGALSVTGNPAYQRPFEPLVPECEAVVFGDAEALARALASRRFAAFVVEPVQAEGGIIVPPSGYLRAARDLCARAGTLLAVDEVQTGFGRTGPLFAVDGEGVEPDLLLLAKSLGGGLVPIGAMLTRRDLWKKAYGTLDTFALHTSTFGGGSLACAAGLAALAVLREPGVLDNGRARARQLWAGLTRLAAEHAGVIREVRGQGLLIGVEFEPPPVSIAAFWREKLGGGTSADLVPGIDGVLAALTATYVMTLLLQEHGIYTQVTRSNPRVLRVEPPLVLTQAEAAQFLEAMEASCREVQLSFRTFDQMIAKAILGQHGAPSEAAPPAAPARADA